MNREWLNKLPPNTVLTPHPKEFERITEPVSDDYSRCQLLRQFAKKYQVTVVLKGAHTAIADKDGYVWFNTTGNPGMATGGSGDVLTGIILALLAQGYTAIDAAKLGVYLHGLAGDLAVKKLGEEALIASDIIEYIGKAFKKLK
jgi:NAD(P)H-hydrate epimerase